MSENEKDNKDFEFIKEQVIEKKSKKYKKWMYPLTLAAAMGVVFGVIAALTICIAEPRLYRLLHSEKDKTQISIPTDDSQDTDQGKKAEKTAPKDKQALEREKGKKPAQEEQKQVIVEKTITADMEDYEDMYTDIRSLALEANKSIVKIYSTEEKKLLDGTAEQRLETTGLVIANENSQLLIIVSLDRIEKAKSIKVEFSGGSTANAMLYDYERDINLAVIAVKLEDVDETVADNVTVANFGESYTISVGNPVIALGCPNGHPDSMDIGIITSKDSAVYITDNKLDLFNVSISDNKNSDGVIINLQGQVIGLITHTLKEDINKELCTAIGISRIKGIIEKLANQEPRSYFGVEAYDMTEDAKKKHDVTYGIYVEEVCAHSPALEGGIKSGDIILKMSGERVTSANSFNSILAALKPGRIVSVRIKRTAGSADKEMNLSVILQQKNKEAKN